MKRYGGAAAVALAAETSVDAADPATLERAFPTRSASALRARLEAVTEVKAGFRRVPLDQIDPAPWQPRIDFSAVQALTRTIGGTETEPGVGVLEPVLLQQQTDGRFRLVDGECRWRAARCVAEGNADAPRDIPALIYDVNDEDAQLMGLVANEGRSAWSVFERAVAYARAQEALERNGRGQGALRRMEAIFGEHKKSSLGVYTSTGRFLTSELMERAAELGRTGPLKPEELSRLTRADLKRIASAANASCEQGALVLHQCARGEGKETRQTPLSSALPLNEQITRCYEHGVALIRSKPLDTMPREDARAMMAAGLLSAFIAVAERGWGAASGPGVFAVTENGRCVLVLPEHPDAVLTTVPGAGLSALEDALSSLRRIVRHAKRRASRQLQIDSPLT